MQIIVYHGTPKKPFKKFSFEEIGTESGIDGAGFGLYFSTDFVDALTYGETVYECRLELERNINNHEITFQVSDLLAILNSSESINHSYYPESNMSENQKIKFIREVLTEFKTDTQIIASIIKNSFGGVCDEICKILSRYGFTHTNDLDTPDLPTIKHFIVYDLEAINIIKIQTLDTINNNDKNLFESIVSLDEKAATSKAQRRLMAMALAHKNGKLRAESITSEIRELSKLPEKFLRQEATTKQANLPHYKKS